MAERFDRYLSVNITIRNTGAFGLLDVVMFKDGAFRLWDTSLLANCDLFAGVVIHLTRDTVTLAMDGVVPVDLADGVYYSDSAGQLVGSLPVGSFDHKVGEVSGGAMVINRKVKDTLASVLIVDTLTGNESDKAPSVRAVNEAFDVLMFTNCGC